MIDPVALHGKYATLTLTGGRHVYGRIQNGVTDVLFSVRVYSDNRERVIYLRPRDVVEWKVPP